MNSSRFLNFLLYPQKRYIYYYRRCHNAKIEFHIFFGNIGCFGLDENMALKLEIQLLLGKICR